MAINIQYCALILKLNIDFSFILLYNTNMSSRVFKSVWDCKENGSMNDFIAISKSIYNSLKVIEEDYSDFFNRNSVRSISKNIEEFNNSFEKIIDICYKKEALNEDRRDEYWKDYLRFELKDENLKDDVIRNENVVGRRITDEYFLQIKREADNIFKIEERCHPTVRELWSRELSSVSEYQPDGEFSLLIKVLADWRKYENSPVKEDYMKNRIGTSCSFITNNRVEKFELGSSDYGYVYDIKKGFLGATDRDSYLEEKIFGYYPEIGSHVVKFNDMFRIYQDKKNELFTAVESTKITTPNELVERFSQIRANEVIVDRRKAKPCAIFYLSYGQKMICKDYEKAAALAKKTGLPLLEIKYLNLDYKYTYLGHSALSESERKRIFEKMSPLEKLQAVLKFKSASEFAVKNYENNMATIIAQPQHEAEYKKLFFYELDRVAEHIIIKNPQTTEELNEAVLDYFTGREVEEKARHLYKPQIRKMLSHKTHNPEEESVVDSY